MPQGVVWKQHFYHKKNEQFTPNNCLGSTFWPHGLLRCARGQDEAGTPNWLWAQQLLMRLPQHGLGACRPTGLPGQLPSACPCWGSVAYLPRFLTHHNKELKGRDTVVKQSKSFI